MKFLRVAGWILGGLVVCLTVAFIVAAWFYRDIPAAIEKVIQGPAFKSLVEATAYGSKAIVDRYQAEGVPIRQVIAIGGVAKKSPFVMQTLSDVLDMPIRVTRSDQACALVY